MTTHLSWETINDYADGVLAPGPDRDVASRHLDACDECRARVEDLRAFLRDANGATAEVAPPDDEYAQGKAAFEREDWPAVIEHMTRAIAERPWDDDAHNLMGFAYRKLGDYDQALEQYDRALALNPHHRGALEYLGEAYLEMDQPELAKGFGFFVGKPATSFAPVAVTPDELHSSLHGDAIALPLRVDVNDAPFGRARPDVDRVFSFADLIAFAAQTRNLGAGTIVGGGTVSNKLDGGPGQDRHD